ncbi:hypothetical protein ACFX14_000396 [Malus domestica]
MLVIPVRVVRCSVPTDVDPVANKTRKFPGGDDKKKKTSENGISQTSAKVSDDGTSSIAKTSGSAKMSGQADFVESGKSNICRGSTSSDISDESTCSSFSSAINKPHKANDIHWDAIQAVQSRDGVFGLGHFRLLKKLGCGDIGSVYLSKKVASAIQEVNREDPKAMLNGAAVVGLVGILRQLGETL